MKLKLCLLISIGALAAEYYKLGSVKRIDRNLYRADDVMIETRYCYFYANGESALLKWDGRGSYENKIYWPDDSTCEVKSVWKK